MYGNPSDFDGTEPGDYWVGYRDGYWGMWPEEFDGWFSRVDPQGNIYGP